MKYELMEQSILKNIQELSEECVDNFHVTNYYELSDLITNLWNIRAKLYKKDNKIFYEIMEEINNEIL